MALGEGEVQRIWKEYFVDLYYIDTQEPICSFDDVLKGNYLRGGLIRRIEVEVRMRKFKNGKAAEEVIGRVINNWNHLIDVVVGCKSLSTFKIKLDEFMTAKGKFKFIAV